MKPNATAVASCLVGRGGRLLALAAFVGALLVLPVAQAWPADDKDIEVLFGATRDESKAADSLDVRPGSNRFYVFVENRKKDAATFNVELSGGETKLRQEKLIVPAGKKELVVFAKPTATKNDEGAPLELPAVIRV